MAKTKNYISNKEFLEELRLSKKQGELTPKAVTCIITMANRLSWKFSYKNPDDRKDCIAQGIMDTLS